MIIFLSGWIFILQAILLLPLLYFFLKRKYSFWSSRGVSGPKPLPVLGNMLQRFTQEPTVFEWGQALKYGKVYGLYYGLQPILTVTDPELIKQVLIKDFTSFLNRRPQNVYHEIFGLNLFNLEDDDWKRVRTITSPAFTSGKLRSMQYLMGRCIDTLDSHLEAVMTRQGGSMDARQVMSGFTIDVITSTSFATETNANDPSAGPFLRYGRKMFNFPLHKVLAFFAFPRSLNDFLNIRVLFPEEPFNFYMNLCKQIVKERRSTNGKRSDLVQLMVDAYTYESELKDTNYTKLAAGKETEEFNNNKYQSNEKKTLTESEIIAQCFLFLTAGFETTSTTLGYVAYEMAINPDVQEKLFHEITQATEGLSRESSQYFDAVMNNISYLDATVKETLRKYPPVLRLERRVTVDEYKLDGISLPRDQVVEIPPLVVHYNPDFYPDPHRFDPQRWMPENKHLLVPYTYLPFGDGPRNCVGMRFAYQEIKLCLAHLVAKYRFKPNSQTPSKLKFKKSDFILAVNEIPLNIEKR